MTDGSPFATPLQGWPRSSLWCLRAPQVNPPPTDTPGRRMRQCRGTFMRLAVSAEKRQTTGELNWLQLKYSMTPRNTGFHPFCDGPGNSSHGWRSKNREVLIIGTHVRSDLVAWKGIWNKIQTSLSTEIIKHKQDFLYVPAFMKYVQIPHLT